MSVDHITCPECTGTNVSKNGKSAKGEQRYICKDVSCEGKSFKLTYTYKGWQADINEQILTIRMDDTGIRDIAKVLGVSKQKVQETLQALQHEGDCLCKGCKD